MEFKEVFEALTIGGVVVGPCASVITEFIKWGLSRLFGDKIDGYGGWIVFAVSGALVVAAAGADMLDVQAQAGERLQWINDSLVALFGFISAITGRDWWSKLKTPAPSWKRE